MNFHHFKISLLIFSLQVLSKSSEFQEILLKLSPISDEEATTWLFISLLDVVLKTKEISPSFIEFLRKLEVPYETSSQVRMDLQVYHVFLLLMIVQIYNHFAPKY